MANERWEGGFVRLDTRGRKVYVIERTVAGTPYKRSTRAHTLAAAMKHLARFEANPQKYDPRGVTSSPLVLDAELVKGYLEYSAVELKNSRGWLRKQRRFLDWWSEKLRGRDLRAPNIDLKLHILPPLKGASSRPHRIAILKGFYTWLRTVEHRITTAEDPVFGQLTVPQGKPAQWKKTKVIPRDHFDLVRGHLIGAFRDALIVQGGTGWHTTEVGRFAAGGRIEPVPPGPDTISAGVLVCPERKSGEEQRTRVLPEALEAAKRLLNHGAFSEEWYLRAVKSACAAVKRPDGEVGIPTFTPGRLRHSVATWAIDAGADPAQVSAFLGHKNPRTTRRFYATHAAPARVPALV